MTESDEESSDSETERRGSTAGRRRASTSANANLSGASVPPVSIIDDIVQLPTRWSKEDRSSSLNISPDGREVHFIGMLCLFLVLTFVHSTPSLSSYPSDD